MKLCHCNWMPLSVADWLSRALEAKGIPSLTYTHTLLSLLHPHFCTKHTYSESKEIEDLEESIHPDADFPQTTIEHLNISPFKNTCNLDQSQNGSHQKWKNKALVYLSAAYDQHGELKELIEDLFTLLNTSELDRKSILDSSNLVLCEHKSINPSYCHLNESEPFALCESLKDAQRYLKNFSIDNNNDEEDVCLIAGYDDDGNMKQEKEKESNMNEEITRSEQIAENVLERNSANQKILVSNEAKEEWECFPQIYEQSKNYPTESIHGSRLFERSTYDWNSEKGQEMELSTDSYSHQQISETQPFVEPWETKSALWNLELVEPIRNSGSELEKIGNPYAFSSLPVSTVDDPIQITHEASINPIGAVTSERSHDTFDLWDIDIRKDVASDFRQWNDSMPLQNQSGHFINAGSVNSSIEDRLFESFHQLGYENIWDSKSELESNEYPFDLSTNISSSMASSVLDNMILESNQHVSGSSVTLDQDSGSQSVHYGPNGPFADLNHAENSGFTSVVPHKEPVLDPVMDKAVSTSQDGSELTTEEENLLTSPRTHFRPIRQDSQNSLIEEEETSEDAASYLGIADNVHNPDLVFHRTGSGTLVLENDIIEGSPKKYMVYKDVADEMIGRVSPVLKACFSDSKPLLDDTTGFVPKFKLVNNEKFSQTEQRLDLFERSQKEKLTNKPCSPQEEIWSTEIPKSIKSIWQSSTKSSEKEIWEVNFDSLAVGTIPDKWNGMATGFQSKSKLRGASDVGAEVLAQVRDLWISTNATDSVTGRDLVTPPICPFDSQSESKLWENSLRKNQYDDQKTQSLDLRPWSPKEFVPQSTSRTGMKNVNGSQWSFDWSPEEDTIMPSPCDLNDGEGCDQQLSPLGDIDQLGWNFNEAFDWEQPTEDEGDGESSQEVLMCKTEDGQTVYLPVEYLDDELYDKIFNTESGVPIGGSLPSLPPSQMEQWKKKLSIKFAKRNRSGKTLPPSRRPCSFFLEGNCRRTDCKFSHDLSSITCRFWEEGTCLKGDMCPFYHGYAFNQRRRNRSEGDQTTDPVDILKLDNQSQNQGRMVSKRGRKGHSFEINSEADFPTLGSSFDSRANSFEELQTGEITKPTKSKRKKRGTAKGNLKESNSQSNSSAVASMLGPYAALSKLTGLTSSVPLVAEQPKQLPATVRKVLKTHQDLLNKQPLYIYHDDGTVSDF